MKKQWPYFLLAFVIPVTAVVRWWGLFSAPEVETGERGAYRYAYLDAQGAYSKLEYKQKEVRRALEMRGPVDVLTHKDPATRLDLLLRVPPAFEARVEARERPCRAMWERDT